MLIGLALWFVLWIWSFAGSGVTDYLLVIVCGFILVVVALTLILSRVGYRDPAMAADEAKGTMSHSHSMIGLRRTSIPTAAGWLPGGDANSFADCGNGVRHDGIRYRVSYRRT